MNFPNEIHVRGSGMPRVIGTIEAALALIDQNLPVELARLPRWSFARALLIEALRTSKSRDINAAARQFRQALRNEHWLDERYGNGERPADRDAAKAK